MVGAGLDLEVLVRPGGEPGHLQDGQSPCGQGQTAHCLAEPTVLQV